MLYNVALVSVIQQSESAVRIHLSPPSCTSLPPFPHPTPLGPHRAPSAELSSLSRTEAPLALSVARACVGVPAPRS